MVQPGQARRDAAGKSREDDKLERSPGLNLVRAGRSDCHVFAYVEKSSKEDVGTAGEKSLKEDTAVKKIGNISKIGSYPVVHVACLNEPNSFAREDAVMELDLLPVESRGYWKKMLLRSGSSRPKPREKSTTIAQTCCSILVPRHPFWISPLLVR